MKIYIMSSGRAAKQVTFHNLPREIQERTTIVVPKEQETEYQRHKLPAVGAPVKRIADARQWVVDQGGYVCMMDDDLVFATRRTDDPTKFVPSTFADITHLFEVIEHNLDTFAHVGVGTREGGNRKTELSFQVARMLRILAYDTDILKDFGIRFDVMELMEDFHVTLALLQNGYPNLVLNHMVHNQGGSNSTGGCSAWRTPQMQHDAAMKLKAMYPNYVNVVKKQSKVKGHWGDRTDVVIQWKRAYNDIS